MTAVEWTLVVGEVALLLILASFTNVIIDRLPVELDEPNEYGETWDTRPWREVVGGRSRCSTCGVEVRPRDNVPVLSYLVLRGRCRACGTPYGAFHLVVELVVPAVGMLITWAVVDEQGLSWVLLPYLFLVPVGVAIAAIDLRTLIVPTRIVWPATVMIAVLCAVAILFEGEPSWAVACILGVVGLAGPLFIVWFMVPTGMGFGDVRLSVLLGVPVGLAAASTGRSPVWGLFMGVACLAVASIVGLVIAVPFLGAGRRKIPFGPALVVAAWICTALVAPILAPIG